MARTPYQRYEESYKLEVVKFYYDHGENRKATLANFEIDHSCLRDWLRRYPNHDKVVSLLEQINKEKVMAYRKLPKDPARAQEEYERIQKELESEKLKAAAYSTMIDIAEQTFDIPIRKKPGAKQS